MLTFASPGNFLPTPSVTDHQPTCNPSPSPSSTILTISSAKNQSISYLDWMEFFSPPSELGGYSGGWHNNYIILTLLPPIYALDLFVAPSLFSPSFFLWKSQNNHQFFLVVSEWLQGYFQKKLEFIGDILQNHLRTQSKIF